MDWRDHFRNALEYSLANQTNVAKRAGISPKKLSDWLGNCDRGTPSIVHAIAMAKAMRLSLDEVFRGISPDDDLAESVRQLVAQAREQGRREALEHIAAQEAAARRIVQDAEKSRARVQRRKQDQPSPKARRSGR